MKPKTRDTYDSARLAGLAFAVRVLVCIWAWDRIAPTADGKFYHVVAQRIAQGDGYTWLWPDGAVTYAAHYPVGYPALMAVPYAIFGPIPGVMMLVNAFLGALAVWFAYGVCHATLVHVGRVELARPSALLVGVILALSPTLVAYTPALMTEGAVATCLLGAARLALAVRATERRGRQRAGLVLLAMVLAAAILLRPQSLLFAPVIGVLTVSQNTTSRWIRAGLVTAGCLAMVAPWTLRNCDKMDRCMLVSANGGWNLLIGTFPEGHGAWVALEGKRVPDACTEVFDEARKDECFGQAATERIVRGPLEWLSLVSVKWRATFDHTAAAADHWVEAGVLSGERKWQLSWPEFFVQRIAHLLAALGVWSLGDHRNERQRWIRLVVLAFGLAGFMGFSAALGWFCTLALLAWAPRHLADVGIGVACFAVLSTAVVHGVFFGAGRYALPLLVLTAPLVALGVSHVLERLAVMQAREV